MTTDHVTTNAGASEPTVSMFDELHHLREILRIDSAFAEALCSTETTTEAAQLAWEHGITVTPEALWRNRGTLASGAMPTWRG